MIPFTCSCGKAMHARDEHAGKTTRCPDCGRQLVIPGAQAVQVPAPPPVVPRDRPDDRPDREGYDRSDPYDRDRPRPASASGMAVTSMILGILSLFCLLFTAIPALILGGLGLRAIGRSQGRLKGKGLAITGLVTGGLGMLLTPVAGFIGYQRIEEAKARIAASNDLKQIGLAMHNYHDVNNGLPPAAICDAKGKPLLSWRVAILPFIEQASLYNQFHLDEPWDSPNNSQLLAKMPRIYALPGDTTAQPGYTYFRVFVGDHAAFSPPQPTIGGGLTRGRTMSQITNEDGTSNTIMVAEAATAVPWTKPDEMPFDPAGPLPALGGHYSDVFLALMADGSIHVVSRKVSERTLRNAIQFDDGNILGTDW